MAIILSLDGQHEQLNPVERAFAYQRLMEILDIDQTQLANLLGVARATVSHCVNFRTRLSSEIVDYCLQHKVELGFAHFRELARLEWNPKERSRRLDLKLLGQGASRSTGGCSLSGKAGGNPVVGFSGSKRFSKF